MKKALALILLAALVLCAFTSCDEEVALNTITLEIEDGYKGGWTFADGNKTAVKEIPAGCTTFGDLVGKFSVKVKKGSSEYTWTLELKDNSYVAFNVGEELSDGYAYIWPQAKAMPDINPSTHIEFGETYDLWIEDYTE